MHQLACALAGVNGEARPVRRRRNPYRRNAHFVLDPSRHSTRLDRNAKARLLVALEVMERKTKAWRRRNGAVSQIGLQVLRALLTRFHNSENGLCCPSIETLQKATGLCRQSIVNALARLEAVGVLFITRRLVRVRDPETGVTYTRQSSNLYGFRELAAMTVLPMPMNKRSASMKLFGRVYRTDGNHIPGQPTAERVENPEGFSGVVLPPRGSNNWRERERQAFRRA